jgi:hypothetical protein
VDLIFNLEGQSWNSKQEVLTEVMSTACDCTVAKGYCITSNKKKKKELSWKKRFKYICYHVVNTPQKGFYSIRMTD